MAKIQTRMDKYKDYREQIKKEEIQENEVSEQEVAQFLQSKKEEKVQHEEVVNKHALEIGEKKDKVKEPKNVYDEYLKRRRIRYFVYSLFVIAIVGTAITFLVLYTANYLG